MAVKVRNESMLGLPVQTRTVPVHIRFTATVIRYPVLSRQVVKRFLQDAARSAAEKLSIGNNYSMSTWLYDSTPPESCYTKATSAYSTLVQLYAYWSTSDRRNTAQAGDVA